MIITEEEAKTKTCPISNESCLASDCPIWRWLFKKETRESHSGGLEFIHRRGVETGRTPKRISYDLYELEAVGYCGLGGVPSL